MAKSKPPSRYSGASDEDFQPGSRKTVLKNKLGITSLSKMDDEEIIAYQKAAEKFANTFASDHRFTAEDVKAIHTEIFGKLYDWAGEYRNKDLSKDGFMFMRAIFIAEQMEAFSHDILEKHTPAEAGARDQLTLLLAQIHVELILIHPFREGNGRAIRLLIHLIAQQAGYQGLDFGFIKETGKEYDRYIAAVQAGLSSNYEPMREIINRALF
ncbi:MAG: Fic/DOC family protein [Bacteroidota bacterium]